MSVKSLRYDKDHALKDTKGDKVFFILNTLFLSLLALIILYPIYFIIIRVLTRRK